VIALRDLLATLYARDVRLWLDGDHLRFRAPKGVLTQELLHELKARKAEILGFLQQGGNEIADRLLVIDHQHAPANPAIGDTTDLAGARRILVVLVVWHDIPSGSLPLHLSGVSRRNVLPV